MVMGDATSVQANIGGGYSPMISSRAKDTSSDKLPGIKYTNIYNIIMLLVPGSAFTMEMSRNYPQQTRSSEAWQICL